MPVFDRVKGGFQALARGAHPTIDYQAFYRATVLRQAPNFRLDIEPEDKRLPLMTSIPLRLGVPGAQIKLRLQDEQGARVGEPIKVLVGWENGQPDRPFCALWLSGPTGAQREQIEKVVFEGTVVELGAAGLTPVQDGVVTGQGKDPYTGLPYWMLGNSSSVVGAKK